uniref:Myosin motor domain-containing protein n=1 Tax=Ascaris lumbricoides TaxID=6252 RepID=A0A0M3HWF9_ASCLU
CGEICFKARRVLTPAFRFNILKKYVEVLNEQSKQFSSFPILGKRMTTRFSASGEICFKARRVLTPAFRFNILKKYVEVFNEQSKVRHHHSFITCSLY